MEPFTQLTAQAAFMPLANIDTDMIIPKQYLKTIKRTGLGRWLFAAQRYDAQGKPNPDFILNRKPQAQILLAGENFGCGSSREHAPWSLLDFGVRAVIAPGFADIFYNNSYKNGLLLVRLDKTAIAALAESTHPITIDLGAQTVSGDAHSYTFPIEPNIKSVLIGGLDSIASILAHRSAIEAFEAKHFARQPWIKGEQYA